jgi:uncharacterized membrane protein YdjX (TVP38/TMEM64 family)
MSKLKVTFVLLAIVCILTASLGMYLISGIDQVQLQLWLKRMGIWAPIVYIIFYTIGTLCILPSTPLNLTGGALFGPWVGTLWASFGAVFAAVVAFAFTRTIGHKMVRDRMGECWQLMDAEICQGGLFYISAVRLLPIIPYGLVNFVAGLTSITFKSYFFGTILGTVPGVLPFVMIGSSGVQALQTGDVSPLLGALTLSSFLVATATWYRRHNMKPQAEVKSLQKLSHKHHNEEKPYQK